MVSIKSLALLTLSGSAVIAVPQYGHARFHQRGTGHEVDLTPLPTGEHHHHHHHNGTETAHAVEASNDIAQQPNVVNAVDAAQTTSCTSSSTYTEYVTSTSIATVTAAKRWDHTYTFTWTGQRGQYTWTQSVAASAPAQTNAPAYSADTSADAGSTATSTAASAASSVASGGSDGVKKGLAYNSVSLLSSFSGASWAYNWAAGAGGSMPSGVEYVPMLWGTNDISAWPAAVNTAITNGASHVLSFNEPDFPTQANIPAAQAATLHIANVANLAGKVKIGSPAITNSNIAGQGIDWMNAFLSACGGAANNCKLDFLAFHWYNNPGTMDDFKSHVSTLISLAEQNNVPKVWLTEFAVNGDSDDQAAFLAEALPYLDSLPQVERYSYFMVGNGQMMTNNALNVVGKAYVA